MTQFPSALTSLLPLAGAVALTVQGIRRIAVARRTAPKGAAPQPAPRPKEPLPPPAPGRAARKPAPDHQCQGCGTTIPARDTECAFCALEKGARTDRRALLRHWLVFVAVMAVVFAFGWLITP
jgi:predicted nucleic acid-binding Zn ribbon protein